MRPQGLPAPGLSELLFVVSLVLFHCLHLRLNANTDYVQRFAGEEGALGPGHARSGWRRRCACRCSADLVAYLWPRRCAGDDAGGVRRWALLLVLASVAFTVLSFLPSPCWMPGLSVFCGLIPLFLVVENAS
jgi:hypothetical protein